MTNNTLMKIHLRMIGCRLNQAEIDTMARQFRQQGHEIVESPEEADQIVVNTCVVTQHAAQDSRKLIRELHHVNTRAAITATGCYAQIAPETLAALPGVCQVIDNTAKDAIVSQLTGVRLEPFDDEPLNRETQPGAAGRTRAFVKAQDGCDNHCTFCVTRLARGKGRSRPQAEILNEIRFLHRAGYQEIVLTGVNLGSYTHPTGDIAALIDAILRETDVPRVRLSSLEPWDLTPEFFDLWENPRMCRHLHLPLQSGCDATLKRMLRRTNQADYRALVQAARERIPGLHISTDIIVGFPGETDDEFDISAQFIEEMSFARMHIFRYSPRPGTPSARMKNHVDNAVKKARSARLHTLAEVMARQYAESFTGQVCEVLWEQVSAATENGFIQLGYTENYLRVRGACHRPLTNQITQALLLDYDTTQALVHAQPILI